MWAQGSLSLGASFDAIVTPGSTLPSLGIVVPLGKKGVEANSTGQLTVVQGHGQYMVSLVLLGNSGSCLDAGDLASPDLGLPSKWPLSHIAPCEGVFPVFFWLLRHLPSFQDPMLGLSYTVDAVTAGRHHQRSCSCFTAES